MTRSFHYFDLTPPAIEETLASLDALHAADRARASAAQARVEQVRAALDSVTATELEDPPAMLRGRHTAGRGMGSPESEAPFVPLPQRTTHGGGFGPAVRAKLIREALEG